MRRSVNVLFTGVAGRVMAHGVAPARVVLVLGRGAAARGAAHGRRRPAVQLAHRPHPRRYGTPHPIHYTPHTACRYTTSVVKYL